MKDRFPSFKKCLAMMRSKNPAVQEDGFHYLRPRAAEFVPQLMSEFDVETDIGLKGWLLELLGDAHDPSLLGLFKDHLRSDNESFRYWAIRGLHLMDTKESRRLLFEAYRMKLETPVATDRFRTELAAVRQQWSF